MPSAALDALAAFGDPGLLGMLLVGVLTGTLVGVIPGLGGTAAVSLVLPFVFGLDPAAAMAVMVGAVAVVHTSDVISAILLAAPGSASAAVVMMDGHALARQGQAARALSASFLASMLGGLLGAVGLTLSIPIARPLVLAFGSPEIFVLCLLGVSFAVSLAEGEMLKGGIAGLLGLLLGTVGAAPTAAEYRFTFGWLTLMEGLPLVAVALGVFGLAEIVDLLQRRTGVAGGRTVFGHGWLDGVKDIVEHRWVLVRGALIGIWAGILPGIGATAGTWMAYGHVVASSKDKSRFGKGDIRGVIAPESANNAVEAGDLIPTLLFGVPGGVPAAIMLGALLIFGIQPGPRIVVDHLDLVYTIIWSFALANVMGAGLAVLMSPLLARLTNIPFATLAPGVILVMLVGAYQDSPQVGTLAAMLLLAWAAWLMKRAGYPRAPLLIGYVLSLPTERYYWLTVNLHGATWPMRPWTAVLLLLLVASLAWGIWGSARSAPRALEAEQPAGIRGRLAVSGGALVVFAAALVASLEFEPSARLLPLLVTVPGVVVSLAQLVKDAVRLRHGAEAKDVAGESVRPALLAFGWLSMFVGLLWLFGLHVATLVFVPLFLVRIAGMGRVGVVAYTAAVLLALAGFTRLFGLTWPRGLF